jgi:nucleoid-associated protein YgaU
MLEPHSARDHVCRNAGTTSTRARRTPGRRDRQSIEKETAMGLIDFVKDAGEKLFGKGKAQAAMTEVKADPDNATKIQAANSAAGDAILDYVKSQSLSATGLTITFDGASSTVTVYGVAPDQPTREKIVLCCGNVSGVAQVKDMMSVDHSAPEAQYYTVVSGDTLSKISKQYYGDANKYPQIFEANKPMLSNPDKIYPGQNLRIPPA